MSEIKRVTGLIRLANLLPALKETFWRFGPSCIGVLTTTLVGLLMVHDPIYKGLVYKGLVDTDWLERVLATMMIATVALTSVKLAGESANWSKAKYAAGVMMVLALIYHFIWQLLNQAFTVTYFIFALAALLSLMFAPYVQRQSDSDSVWYFNYQMGVGVFFAAFSALILGIGLLLIVASLGYLFEFKVPEKLFLDIWVVCWAGYFPLYILANIPKTFNFEQQHCEFPKGVKFIVNFILVPLMFAYMAILYAYFVKMCDTSGKRDGLKPMERVRQFLNQWYLVGLKENVCHMDLRFLTAEELQLEEDQEQQYRKLMNYFTIKR